MTRAKRWLSALLHGLIMASALAACAHTGSVSLDDTRWTLTGWSISSQHAADTGITAAFSNGNLTGHSGVNTYGGTYITTPAGAFLAGRCRSRKWPVPNRRCAPNGPT